MRRAFKRYLIVNPPPILVFHLKRFEQITGRGFGFGGFAGSEFFVVSFERDETSSLTSSFLSSFPQTSKRSTPSSPSLSSLTSLLSSLQLELELLSPSPTRQPRRELEKKSSTPCLTIFPPSSFISEQWVKDITVDP